MRAKPPMYRVSTVHLSADAGQAGPTIGTIELGELAPAQLFALLERFRQIDAIQNHEAEPQILVTARPGRFIIRTGHGKLFLYNARDSAEPYAELTAAAIITQLERNAITAAPFGREGNEPPPPPPSTPHRAIAGAILAAGLALNGYTLYSAFYLESVNERPPVTLITEGKELATRQHDVVGIFATGDQAGDRVVEVRPDGQVKFSEVGSKNSINENSDTYRIGRRGKKLCLTTTESGMVDVLNFDTVVYYRDTYRRTK